MSMLLGEDIPEHDYVQYMQKTETECIKVLFDDEDMLY